MCVNRPAAVGARLAVALQSPLPHTVGHGVPDGRHHHAQLHGPVVQIQGAHAGQVGAQVPVDPRALDADQSPQVETGPVWIWREGRGNEFRQIVLQCFRFNNNLEAHLCFIGEFSVKWGKTGRERGRHAAKVPGWIQTHAAAVKPRSMCHAPLSSEPPQRQAGDDRSERC